MSRHVQRQQRPPRRPRWEPATVGTVGLAVVLLALSAVFLSWGHFDDPVASRTTSVAAEVPPAPATTPTATLAPTAAPTPAALESAASATPPPAQRIVLRNTPILPKVVVRPARKPAVEVIPPLTFRVSSFNMLGASHTVPGGEHAGHAPGPVRARWGAALLRGAEVTVAGLQELEPSQYAAFRAAAPGWEAYPGTRLAHKSTANSIVWDDSAWELVEGHTIEIPYFHGHLTPMPYLKLRDRTTGREVWFANFHNPADVHGPAARWRAVAVAKEVVLANQLTSAGTPLVMTGDMNDREAYFCPMTTRTQLHAALGGSTGPGCAPPRDMTVDWIMGSPGVVFSNYHSVTGGLVARTSDHHFLWTDATVGAPSLPGE